VIPANPYAYFFDLLDTLGKFLQRPDVQRQIIAILAVAVLALLLTRWLRKWVGPAYVRWLWKHHREFHDPQTGRRTLRYHLARTVMTFANFLLLPALTLVGLRIATNYFVRQAWLTGLIARIDGVVWILVAYGIFLALLHLFFYRRVVRQYQRRLLAPAVAVIVFFYLLDTVADLPLLGATPIIPFGQVEITLAIVTTVILLLYFWFVMAWAITDIAFRSLTHWTRSNKGALAAGLTIARYILIGIGVVIAGNMLGFNATTVAAITGGFSIGIGFALQDVLKNFFGGILILFEGSVRPGDYVVLGANEGVVDRINIRSTVVRTEDSMEIVVPNGDWLRTPVNTYTGSSRDMRIRLDFAFKNNANAADVMGMLVEAAMMNPNVLQKPEPRTILVNYSAAVINYQLQFWIEDAIHKLRVSSEVRESVYTLLEERDIELA
jgi:small-conductance mechanosensitive channel